MTLLPDRNRTVDVMMKKKKLAVPDKAPGKKVVPPKKKHKKPVQTKPVKPKPVQPEKENGKILINNPFG